MHKLVTIRATEFWIQTDLWITRKRFARKILEVTCLVIQDVLSKLIPLAHAWPISLKLSYAYTSLFTVVVLAAITTSGSRSINISPRV